MVSEVKVAGVELDKIRRDIEALQTQRDAKMAEARTAMAEGDFDAAIRIGGEAALIEAEIVKASQKLARLDSTAAANVLGQTAQELKALVTSVVEPNAAAILELVRQIWGLQPANKLTSIVLGFDYERPSAMPTISLRGGFATGRTRNAPNAPRAKWIDDTDGATLGRKAIVMRYGAKYGQSVAFSEMSPGQRVDFSNQIIAAEGLRQWTEEDEDNDEE